MLQDLRRVQLRFVLLEAARPNQLLEGSERAFDGLTSEQIDTFREVLEVMRANLCDRPDQGDAQ